MIELSLLMSALLLGLLGSLHCLGMCGGISTALSVTLNKDGAPDKAYYIYYYHLGRMLGYVLIGLMISLVGVSIKALLGPTGAHLLRGLAACCVILVGLSFFPKLPRFPFLQKIGLQFWQMISPLRRHVLPVTSPVKAIALGACWGLIPCGMVYSAIALALTAPGPIGVSLVMMVFALGTLPMMLSLSFCSHTFAEKCRGPWQQSLAGSLLVVVGCWTLFSILAH